MLECRRLMRSNLRTTNGWKCHTVRCLLLYFLIFPSNNHTHTHTHTHKHTHKHSLTQTLTHLHALTHTHSYAPLTILSLRFYFSISPLPPFSESTVCVRDFDKLNVRHCGFFGFCLKSILAYDTVAPEKGCLL